MSNLFLQPATVPADTPLPANAQQLINLTAANLKPTGFEGVEGVIVSSTEPTAEHRDRVWFKKDPQSGRVVGSYVYKGGWQPVPVVIPSGENPPAGAKLGELFFNTLTEALEIYNGTQWTTNFWDEGGKADRPKSPPLNYLFFDTDIGRLLRFTSQGWTTVDGGVGDLKMLIDVTDDEATERNPGWAIYAGFAGRFPRGRSDTVAVGEEGGREKILWAATGGAAHGLSREQPLISSITLDGKTEASRAGNGQAVNTSTNGEIPILPPFKAVIFLRKQF